jgi:hypothetical protein
MIEGNAGPTAADNLGLSVLKPTYDHDPVTIAFRYLVAKGLVEIWARAIGSSTASVAAFVGAVARIVVTVPLPFRRLRRWCGCAAAR